MKLIIELTNGKRDACGDSEMVSYLLAGISKDELERTYNHKIPEFYFEV